VDIGIPDNKKISIYIYKIELNKKDAEKEEL